MNFNPNCTWRDVVTVVEITPQLGAMVVALVKAVSPLGTLEFGWVGRLNISARNSNRRVASSANDFATERSKLTMPGPISVSRPRFPRWLAGCNWNALTFHQ